MNPVTAWYYSYLDEAAKSGAFGYPVPSSWRRKMKRGARKRRYSRRTKTFSEVCKRHKKHLCFFSRSMMLTSFMKRIIAVCISGKLSD